MPTPSTPPDLRAMVAQVVREIVADHTAARPVTAPSNNAGTSVAPRGSLDATGRSRSEVVRITDDADLQHFARRLLDLFENPKMREDLRTGRLRFELTGGVAAPSAPGAFERIDQGAVTERKVAAAAAAGARLVIGPHAVLTPLAREKARALGVPIEKERR